MKCVLFFIMFATILSGNCMFEITAYDWGGSYQLTAKPQLLSMYPDWWRR